ncbi:MAG: energy-coupling factor ABC transporter substrate-binding protein [Oscillatoriales cyanobacterium]|uniref:energy-coupling factor ABC transporter substrate-binding protein n=1 Tax=unclassified Microcoleus TaxID=2642155 RepID=UPI001E18E17E|nr:MULTISPECIES: energy-coupling factor ABC transporter substrate-binding protein [unclassified Microcoleus]TAE84559.1 MAG: energy-coupling factor ABC transporter substrate-binding protein [Oscillatoriales cyanobacterium]TAE93444.1 MAG: energy-coupling factor ABC transporter substrate-binding protein [Oscillatoriales cyanobacterium]TAF15191.1 MAG: energy-coupling factor ABC transporter substrate-binding protein [Oscillatoriales cyanobacterium]TAF28297.1 MAG: energy-coupling factor ABC transport
MNQKPTKNQQATSQQNWMLVIGVVALAVIPLVFVRGEYGGSDDRAQKAITEIQPDYKPWFNHLFEPPSAEIASLLFATQAALGAGVIGYAIGLYKGRSQSQQSDDKSPLE